MSRDKSDLLALCGEAHTDGNAKHYCIGFGSNHVLPRSYHLFSRLRRAIDSYDLHRFENPKIQVSLKHLFIGRTVFQLKHFPHFSHQLCFYNSVLIFIIILR